MDAAPAQDPRRPWRQDAEIIALVGAVHACSHFYHLMLPPLFPWLMRDFGLGYTEVGVLMSVFFVVSGLGQAAAGFVVDRVGAWPVLMVGVALLAASAVSLGLAQSYAGLVLAAAIAGLGNSVFHPADFSLLNHGVAPARLGHAFAVHGLAGNLGWAAAPVFMVAVASLAGWHTAAFAAAGVGVATLLLLVWRRAALVDGSRDGSSGGRRDGAWHVAAPSGASLAFLRSSAVWLCFTFFLLSTLAFGVLQNFAPAIFKNVYGLDLTLATAGLSAYLLGSAAGTVAGGFLAARSRDNERLIAAALGLAAGVALLLAGGAVGAAAVLPLMVLMGLGVGVAGPNRDLLVRRAATSRFGKTSFGRVYGFVYSGLDVGLAVAPLVVGTWLDAGHFQAPLLLVGVLQVAALLTALRVGVAAREPSLATRSAS